MKTETYKLFENSPQVATPKTRVLHILRYLFKCHSRDKSKGKNRENGGKITKIKNLVTKIFQQKFQLLPTQRSEALWKTFHLTISSELPPIELSCRHFCMREN